MKKTLYFALAAVVLQVGILAFMAGQREWIARHGKIILLRTAPVDPRDAMRGDYARLDYDISHVPQPLWSGSLTNSRDSDNGLRRDLKVFAALAADEDGIHDLTAVSAIRPTGGTFLRGHTDRTWGGEMHLRYGIEALFMEQGKAQELENLRSGEKSGVPMLVRVAVSPGGIAVLKDWRWDKLGIRLDLVSTNRPARFGQQTIILGAKVVLKNHSDENLAIVDLPENRSFALITEQNWGWRSGSSATWVNASNAVPKPRPADVVILKPGDSHTNSIDLTQPQWFVTNPNPTNAAVRSVAIADLTGNWSFRLEYRPPARVDCAGLPDSDCIWHGRLKSRRFWTAGGVD